MLCTVRVRGERTVVYSQHFTRKHPWWMASEDLLLTAELTDGHRGKGRGVILPLPPSLYQAVTPPAKLDPEGLLGSVPVWLCARRCNDDGP